MGEARKYEMSMVVASHLVRVVFGSEESWVMEHLVRRICSSSRQRCLLARKICGGGLKIRSNIGKK